MTTSRLTSTTKICSRNLLEKYFTKPETNLYTSFAISPFDWYKKDTAIMDSDPETEADFKARLQYSRESVTQFQISVDALKYEAKHAQGLLEAKLSKLSKFRVSMYRSLGHAWEVKDPADDTAPLSLKLKMEELTTHCSVLLLRAKSIVDAKKIDGIIAEVEFDIFTPPNGITDWVDWLSHRDQLQAAIFYDLIQAVNWWEQQRQTWEGIHKTVSKTRDDLYRDIKCLEGIQEVFAENDEKKVCPQCMSREFNENRFLTNAVSSAQN